MSSTFLTLPRGLGAGSRGVRLPAHAAYFRRASDVGDHPPRGNPSICVATMFSWISDVPPEMLDERL